ncbi:MAG: hypothetical protein LBR39_03785 [Coriobacteriales bacterium]|nr:hypothetical protein [Coriobacteriales bacterium]
MPEAQRNLFAEPKLPEIGQPASEPAPIADLPFIEPMLIPASSGLADWSGEGLAGSAAMGAGAAVGAGTTGAGAAAGAAAAGAVGAGATGAGAAAGQLAPPQPQQRVGTQTQKQPRTQAQPRPKTQTQPQPRTQAQSQKTTQAPGQKQARKTQPAQKPQQSQQSQQSQQPQPARTQTQQSTPTEKPPQKQAQPAQSNKGFWRCGCTIFIFLAWTLIGLGSNIYERCSSDWGDLPTSSSSSTNSYSPNINSYNSYNSDSSILTYDPSTSYLLNNNNEWEDLVWVGDAEHGYVQLPASWEYQPDWDSGGGTLAYQSPTTDSWASLATVETDVNIGIKWASQQAILENLGYTDILQWADSQTVLIDADSGETIEVEVMGVDGFKYADDGNVSSLMCTYIYVFEDGRVYMLRTCAGVDDYLNLYDTGDSFSPVQPPQEQEQEQELAQEQGQE